MPLKAKYLRSTSIRPNSVLVSVLGSWIWWSQVWWIFKAGATFPSSGVPVFPVGAMNCHQEQDLLALLSSGLHHPYLSISQTSPQSIPTIHPVDTCLGGKEKPVAHSTDPTCHYEIFDASPLDTLYHYRLKIRSWCDDQEMRKMYIRSDYSW